MGVIFKTNEMKLNFSYGLPLFMMSGKGAPLARICGFGSYGIGGRPP